MMMMMMITIIIRKKTMSSVFVSFFGFIMKKVWRDSWSIQVLLGPRPARRMSIKSSRSLFGTRTTQKKTRVHLEMREVCNLKEGVPSEGKVKSWWSWGSSWSLSFIVIIILFIFIFKRFIAACKHLQIQQILYRKRYHNEHKKHGLWSTHINTNKSISRQDHVKSIRGNDDFLGRLSVPLAKLNPTDGASKVVGCFMLHVGWKDVSFQ